MKIFPTNEAVPVEMACSFYVSGHRH